MKQLVERDRHKTHTVGGHNKNTKGRRRENVSILHGFACPFSAKFRQYVFIVCTLHASQFLCGLSPLPGWPKGKNSHYTLQTLMYPALVTWLPLSVVASFTDAMFPWVIKCFCLILYWNHSICLSVRLSICGPVRVSNCVHMTSPELLNHFLPNLLGWCIIMYFLQKKIGSLSSMPRSQWGFV